MSVIRSQLENESVGACSREFRLPTYRTFFSQRPKISVTWFSRFFCQKFYRNIQMMFSKENSYCVEVNTSLKEISICQHIYACFSLRFSKFICNCTRATNICRSTAFPLLWVVPTYIAFLLSNTHFLFRRH